ncbi:hypothetical protein [uncultured Anaeromusa sp.]|uniref:hypothetical protein n=1 Tax=uncultured Anaeromusa sp. TaxID=673273 RepID=UPI0029C7C674|nr:hypothetical protein [uncultured Anaeromusa sp.]
MNKNTAGDETVENTFVFNTAQTCEFFNVSRETLSGWAKRGAPKEGRGAWDLKKLVEWKLGTDKVKEESPELRKLKADVRFREIKADLEEIKKLEKVGQYVSVDDVEKSLAEVFLRVKQGLLFIGHRVATELNAQYPELALDAKRLVDEEVAKGLAQLAKTGTYGSGKRGANTTKSD